MSEGRKPAWARGGSPLELAGKGSIQRQGSVAPTASRHLQIWLLHPGRACRELSVWAPQAPRGRSAGASSVLQCAVPPAEAVSWLLLPEGSGHVECLLSGYVRGQGGRGSTLRRRQWQKWGTAGRQPSRRVKGGVTPDGPASGLCSPGDVGQECDRSENKSPVLCVPRQNA